MNQLFAILTLGTPLYKSVYAFFLETSISEKMGDLKGRRFIKRYSTKIGYYQLISTIAYIKKNF